jgi:hypothetical protein
MTDEEFKIRWKQLSNKQRKFCLRYVENGFSAKDAAIEVGYNGCYIKSPIYRIMRKVNDVIDYLIAKNNIVQSICKPAWIYSEYLKLYNNTTSELTKQNILKELSKILSMQNDGAKVEVTNNIPATPVTIKFGDE